MKKQNKLISGILAIFMLWIGGVNVCMAQCDPTCVTQGGRCFEYQADPLGGETSLDPPLCLAQQGVGTGTAYCVDLVMDVVLIPYPAGGCGAGNTVEWYVVSLPLSDASFLLVFLLGIYGIYTYRKRRGIQTELIEK